MLDLALAIHAALSELGSARDYLSTWFARRLGAPPKVDSLANLLRWLPKGPKKGLWPMGQRRSEEHTSELQSLMRISYAVFCLKKKTHKTTQVTKPQRRRQQQYNKKQRTP